MNIDKQLQADCHQLGIFRDIAILLHKNAILPWFILVPLSTDTKFRELYELSSRQRGHLQQLADALSKYLIARDSEKINIAALGNVVEQLHLHLIGRRRDDCCWPDPVWGNLTGSEDYPESAQQEIREDITQLIQQLT